MVDTSTSFVSIVFSTLVTAFTALRGTYTFYKFAPRNTNPTVDVPITQNKETAAINIESPISDT